MTLPGSGGEFEPHVYYTLFLVQQNTRGCLSMDEFKGGKSIKGLHKL